MSDTNETPANPAQEFIHELLGVRRRTPAVLQEGFATFVEPMNHSLMFRRFYEDPPYVPPEERPRLPRENIQRLHDALYGDQEPQPYVGTVAPHDTRSLMRTATYDLLGIRALLRIGDIIGRTVPEILDMTPEQVGSMVQEQRDQIRDRLNQTSIQEDRRRDLEMFRHQHGQERMVLIDYIGTPHIPGLDSLPYQKAYDDMPEVYGEGL
jgi:hypothetical protein